MSHQGLTSWSPPRKAAMATRRNPRPTHTSAITNLVGLEGSRLPRRIQAQAKTGASATRKKEFMDWNQPAGNSQPKTTRRVKRWAKRLRLEPACSKAPQNRVAD